MPYFGTRGRGDSNLGTDIVETTSPTSLPRNPILRRKKNSNRLLTYLRGRFCAFPVGHRSGVPQAVPLFPFTIVVSNSEEC